MEPGGDEDAVRAALAQIWTEEIPSLPFDETISWRDSGVDSLKGLQLILKLEKALGLAIPLDLFTRDSRIGEVIAVLGRRGSPSEPVGAAGHSLFLLPGIYGDQPNLAEFRRSLAGKVRFETLAYRDMTAPASLHQDMDATVDLVVAAVQARQPDGPLCIAGYSYGGFVAFEAARRLMASGREVGLLVLLDPLVGWTAEPREDAPPAFLTRYPLAPRIAMHRGESPGLYLERMALEIILKLGLLEAARRLSLWAQGHNSVEENERRRLKVLMKLRGLALRRWRPQPCTAPSLLITSDFQTGTQGPDVWARLCPNLTAHHVGGGHLEIFEAEGLAGLNPTLLEALSRVNGAPGPQPVGMPSRPAPDLAA
jgi:thioesterase domain-containing protein/acyl carrier protein